MLNTAGNDMTGKPKILLILPAYNEEESIGAVLESIREQHVDERMDVLVINDGSSDKTLEVVASYGFEALSQVYNMGYGAALQTAYKYACDQNYDYLLQMDADGQHDLANLDLILAKLLGEGGAAAACEGAGENDAAVAGEGATVESDGSVNSSAATTKRTPDIVIGSRFLEGAQSFAISPVKKPVIAAFRGIITLTTKYKLTDPTSGLWGLNRAALEVFKKRNFFDVKYPDLNMILQMLLLGFHIEEIPAIMHERSAGTSMHSGIGNALRYAVIMGLSTVGVLIRSRNMKAEMHG